MHLCNVSCMHGPMNETHKLVLKLTKEIAASMKRNKVLLTEEERKKWKEIEEEYEGISNDSAKESHIILHSDNTIEMSLKAKRAMNGVIDFFTELMKKQYYRKMELFHEAKELLFLFMLEEYNTADFARYFS